MGTIPAGKRKRTALTMLAVLIILFALGWPQWVLVYTAARLYTGSFPSLGNVSLTDPLRIERLSIHKEDQNLSFSNFRLDYDLFPQWGHPTERFFPALHVESVDLPIALETFRPLAIKPESMPSASVNTLRYIPQDIHIDFNRLRFGSNTQPHSVSLGPFELNANIASSSRWNVSLTADTMSIDTLLDNKMSTVEKARLNLVAERRESTSTPGRIYLPKIELTAPPLAEISGTLTADFISGPLLSFEVPTFKLHDIDLSVFSPNLLPIPIKFAALDASGSIVNLLFDPENPKVSPTHAQVQINGLQIGLPEDEYYNGDILLTIEGSDKSDHSVLQAEAMFSKGQQARLSCALKPWQGVCNLSLTDWTRNDLQTFIPKNLSNKLSILDTIHHVSSETTVNYDRQSISGHSNADLSLQLGDTTLIPARLSGSWHVPVSSLYDTSSYTVNAHLDMQSASAGIEISPNNRLICNVTNIDPSLMLQILNNSQPIPDLHALLSGMFSVDLSTENVIDNEQYLNTTLNLNVSGLQYRDLVPPKGLPLTIEGAGKVKNRYPYAMKDWNLLIASENLVKVIFTNLSLRLDTFEGAGMAEAIIDLPGLSMHYGVGSFQGRLTLQGDIASKGGRVRSKPVGLIEGAGWGKYIIPEQIRISTQDTLVYDKQNASLKGTRISINGVDDLDHFTLTLHDVESTFSPRSFKTHFSGSTGLRLLQSIGLADQAEGTAKIDGDLAIDAQDATGQISMEAKGDILKFKQYGITIGNASLIASATHTPTEGLKGTGLLAIQNMGFSTFTAHDLKGDLRFAGKEAILADESCTLLGAKIAGEVRVGILESETPVSFNLQISELDLSLLLKELKLDQFKVDGIAEGSLNGKLSTSGIQNMTLALTSPNGIRLDQRSVAQLLVSQTGNARVVEKMVKKVLGSDEMVPFEKATLDLRYEKNQFVGTAHLDGAKVSLVIDLTIDPKAILTALGVEQGIPAP